MASPQSAFALSHEGADTADFRQAERSEDLQHVQELFTGYLRWANLKFNELLGTSLDVEAKVAQDMTELLPVFSPPDGRLTLAALGSEVVGLAACGRSAGG